MQTHPNLMESLASPDNLLAAWRSVRGNIPRYRRQRSAGPDGVTLEEFERELPVQLNALRYNLLKDRYQAQPPNLFSIEKRSGGTRQLALLNVTDRVAQRAAQQVIEPLYEPNFLPCSFGFRPGRSIQDAVYCARQLRGHGYAWIVDGDIAACFDSLDHKLLLQRVSKQVNDQRVLDLLQQWLGIGILKHGLPAEPANWFVQGMQKATSGLQQGVDWALETITRPEQPDDPYASARYETVPYPGITDEPAPELFRQNPAPTMSVERFYNPPDQDKSDRRGLQQRAIQQISAGGLLMGTSWARHYLAKAAPAAIAALKSPLSREVIVKGLLAGGGVVGAAAGLALTTYFLVQQAAPAPVGVLQGSPLSPLLANIYLHSFDVSVTRSGYRLVRYADDWVILCPDQNTAEIAYNQATIALAKINLKINRAKTRILTPSDPLEWLGVVVE